MLLAACGVDLKNKSSPSGRVQSVSSPPVDAQSPFCFVVESSPLPVQFSPRNPRLRRNVDRGGVCLCARASRSRIASPPLLPKMTRGSLGDHARRTTYDPTLPPRPSLAATRSSKNVSLPTGESGLTPAKKTPYTCQKPARACLAACLIEAARGTEGITGATGLWCNRRY